MDGNEIELKDDDDDDFQSVMKDNSYASDDEIEASGYYIENVEDNEDQDESSADAFINALLSDSDDELFGDEEEDE